MEATSQNTAESIFICQNDAFLLQCQMVQRSEYSKAKTLARRKAICTLIFAVLSVVVTLLNIDWLSAISSFWAVALALFNKQSDENIKTIKKYAASIQQYIDASLFATATGTIVSDWGDVPNKSDLAEAVSKHSNKDTSAYVNWYSDYSTLNGESQVFYCQRENVRWDYSLHKEYKKLYVILLSMIAIALLVAFLAVNPSFLKAVYVLSWFLPVAEYLFSVVKEVDTSICLLHDIDNATQELEKALATSSSRTLKRKLIELQYKIWNCREKGFLIPDWFYEHHRKKQQEKEDNMAKIIQSLDE